METLNFEFSDHLPIEDNTLTLMLREWTSQGYVTRDYRVLSLTRAKIEAKPETVAAKPQNPTTSRKKKPEAKANAKISINHASADELATVKGLSAKVVAAIIAGRPFADLEALCSVKGMGEKLLAKVRTQLTCP